MHSAIQCFLLHHTVKIRMENCVVLVYLYYDTMVIVWLHEARMDISVVLNKAYNDYDIG